MPDDHPEPGTAEPDMAGNGPLPLSLSLSGVTVAVGSVEICSEVSLEVDAGHVVGIIGPNGSGKTTLLRTVYRVLRPRLGRVVVGEDDIWELQAIRGRSAYRRRRAGAAVRFRVYRAGSSCDGTQPSPITVCQGV